MKISMFLIISFFLLAPFENFNGWSHGFALGEYASSYPNRKKSDNEYISYATPKRRCPESPCQKNQPKPVNAHVQYEPTEQEKLVNKRIKTEEELCQKEVEVVKQAAAKWQSEKNKKPEVDDCPACKEVPFSGPEVKCDILNKGASMCAECEQCEVQVKSNGEGVVLKCKDCREVGPEEIVFPAGNRRRIIKLP